MGYIYVIENLINHKKYVGQTIDPNMRWKRHKTDDIKDPTLLIGKAFLKYGIENFTFTVIEECEDSLMSKREEYWICELKTCIKDKDSHGYNMTRGGKAMFGNNNPFYGKTHTEETKQVLSKLAKERIGEKNSFYKHKHSEETRQKISQANKGRKHTEEELKIMSEKQLGEKNHFYGKCHTEESKEKIRKSKLGKTPYNAIPYIAENDSETLYFESLGKVFNWLKEHNLVDETFTMSKLKTRVKNSENKHILFVNYYWHKSVETIPDECKGVESEIGTDSKCAAPINIGEEIVHTIGNNG